MSQRGLSVGVAAGTMPPGVLPGEVTFLAGEERELGSRSWFQAHAAAYRSWYLKDGDAARPELGSCRRMLQRHMPELVPGARALDLAGGAELDARILSLYNPPVFVSGCSQVAWTRDTPALTRNYDYPASHLEGLLLLAAWRDRRDRNERLPLGAHRWD